VFNGCCYGENNDPKIKNAYNIIEEQGHEAG